MNLVLLDTPAPARTYGRLVLRGDVWVLEDIEPHVSLRLKQIFPRIPKTETCPFRLKRSNTIDADLAWFIDRYPLRMGTVEVAALREGKSDYLARQAEIEAILTPSYVAPTFIGMREGQGLRHYQAQAVDAAYLKRSLLLGDECGLGKTYVGAGLCLKPGTCPVAIVCQGHIQPQWIHRLTEFSTLRTHAINKASPYSLPEADVYVFRYSQIRGWAEIFAAGLFRTAIFDEPQELRTGMASDKGRAAIGLAARAGWRLGLTATPIYNYGTEMWNVMRCIDPDVLGDYEDFAREYVSADTKRLKDPKALGTYLREQHVFIRRTKADVGKELQPVNRIIDVVDSDAEQFESIEALARQLAIRATTGMFTERGAAARELDMMVRQATGVAKAKGVASYVRMLVKSGEPVLLVGWHRAVYDIWAKQLADLLPAFYTGSESNSQKVAAKNRFAAGETDLIIMSLRSAAGLDGLQHRCSTVVFGELDWSPGIHHQVIERIDRDGQTRPVMALFLVAEDGSDPPIMEMLGLKASDAHQVVDPLRAVAEAHSDERRLAMLARRYLDGAPGTSKP